MLDTMIGVWTCERTKPRPWRGEPWTHYQLKLDGWRLTAFGQGGWTAFFGRQMAASREMSHLLDHLPWYHDLARLPREMVVDGELCVPGKPASEVTSALANRGELTFTAFHPNPWVPWLHMHPARDNTPPVIEGVEGVVLCNGTQRWKYKYEETMDLVVTGIKPGKGKFAGQCGALITEMANVSGMDDATRAKITSADIGRVIEVRYQYIGAGGRLRHPRFVRWRDDKETAHD